MAVAGDLVVNLTANNRLTGQLNRIAPQIGGFVNKTTNMLARLGLAAQGLGSIFRTISPLAKSAIKQAADMETLAISFEVLTGNAKEAKRLLAEVFRFSDSTPFEPEVVADAAKKLLAFGFASKEVVPELRKLGNLSSALGIPLGELAEIYGKARVQGRLFMEDINQLTGRGIPITQALADTMGVGKDQIRKMVEQGKVGFPELRKAMDSLTTGAGKFAGMTERQSESLNGLWSTLKGGFNQLLATQGKNLVDSLGLKDLVKTLIGVVKAGVGIAKIIGPLMRVIPMLVLFRSHIKLLGIVLEKVINPAVEYMVKFAESVDIAFDNLVMGVRWFAKNFVQLFKNIAQFGGDIFHELTQGMVNLFIGAFKAVLRNAKIFGRQLLTAIATGTFDLSGFTLRDLDAAKKNFDNALGLLTKNFAPLEQKPRPAGAKPIGGGIGLGGSDKTIEGALRGSAEAFRRISEVTKADNQRNKQIALQEKANGLLVQIADNTVPERFEGFQPA